MYLLRKINKFKYRKYTEKSSFYNRGRFKVGLTVVLVGVLLAGFTGAWLLISTVQQVAYVSNSDFVSQKLEKVKTELAAIQPKTSIQSCWLEAKNLFNLDHWADGAIENKFNNLKSACLGGGQSKCETTECSRQIEPNQTKGGIRL